MARSNKSIPARTPEGEENQLINLAVKLAKKKLMDGTASSQIITTLLNLATTKHQLELDKLRSDLQVAEAKIKSYEDQAESKDLYAEVLSAMKSYQGINDEEDSYDYDDYY